jgi:hypothetical protein
MLRASQVPPGTACADAALTAAASNPPVAETTGFAVHHDERLASLRRADGYRIAAAANTLKHGCRRDHDLGLMPS